jgi:Transposase DDE domain
MDAAVRQARRHRPWRKRSREVAVDSTGLESGHRSRHYALRLGKSYRARTWPKLTVACDTATHLLASACASSGPSQEAPLWLRCLRPAARRINIDRAVGDAGFDSEPNHAVARRALGIRSTVIKLNPRRTGRRWPKSKYRRQMRRRFHKLKYRNRVQAESCFSRHKRRLGSFLRARTDAAQTRELYLRVLTHNLMLLAVH